MPSCLALSGLNIFRIILPADNGNYMLKWLHSKAGVGDFNCSITDALDNTNKNVNQRKKLKNFHRNK